MILKNKRISLPLTLLEILLCVALFVKIFGIVQYNKNVECGQIMGKHLYKFVTSMNTDNPYMQKEDLQRADLVDSYLAPVGYTALNMPGFHDVTFTLKNTLTYYTEPSVLSDHAVTIKKGTTCYDDYKDKDGIGNAYQIFGFRSWPSYLQGWRIVIPFATDENIEMYRANDVKTSYYIRTKDLYQAYTDYCGEHTDDVYWNFYEKDKILYQRGYFFSLDFFKPIRVKITITMVTAIVGIGILLTGSYIRRRVNQSIQ